jgi:hypothetical protein
MSALPTIEYERSIGQMRSKLTASAQTAQPRIQQSWQPNVYQSRPSQSSHHHQSRMRNRHRLLGFVENFNSGNGCVIDDGFKGQI